MTGLSRYWAILGRPSTARILGATLIWGAAGTMYPVVLVLFVHDATGSYYAVGIVAAASAIGRAVLAPLRGRLVETQGAGRSLARLATVQVAATVALIVAGSGGLGVAVLAPLALIASSATPPVSAVTRALLSEICGGPSEQHLGYSLLTVLQEAASLGGPLIAGVILLATASPTAGMYAAAALAFAGTLYFARAQPVQVRPPAERPPTRLGALASPGVRTLMTTAFGSGIAFGVLEVAFPAFAETHGAQAAAGWLLAAAAAGLGIGGLLYGLVRTPPQPRTAFAVFCGLSALGIVPLATADSVTLLVPLAFVAGVCSAPMVTCQYSLIDLAARRGTEIEAFTWITSIYAGGMASGAAITGWLAQHGSLSEAFLVSAGAMAAMATIAAVRRGTFASTRSSQAADGTRTHDLLHGKQTL